MADEKKAVKAPAIKVAKDILLANHHAGPITLPRVYQPNAGGDPAAMQTSCESRTIQPGHVESIPAAEWELRLPAGAAGKNSTLQYYLDHKHLEVVKRAGEVDVNTGAIGVLEVPEHLQADQEGNVTVASAADGSEIKAGVRSANKGTVTV
jgi:hypothetical protein